MLEKKPETEIYRYDDYPEFGTVPTLSTKVLRDAFNSAMKKGESSDSSDKPKRSK